MQRIEKLNIISKTVVRAEISNFHIPEGQLIKGSPEKWGWVSFDSLIRCLEPLFENLGGTLWKRVDAKNVFKHFGYLNGSIDGKPLLTYIRYQLPYEADGFNGTYWLHEDTHSEPEPDVYYDVAVYVPALWSNNVIDLVTRGVMSIRLRKLKGKTYVTEGVDGRGKAISLKRQGKRWTLSVPV